MGLETESLIASIISKLDDEIINKLKNWGKSIQLFIDNESYFVNVKDSLELKKGEMENPDFTIRSSLNTFTDILQGRVNPVEAVVSGEVTIDGSLTSALEF